MPGCGGSPSAPEPTPTPTAPAPQTTAVTYSGTFQSSDGSFGSLSVTANIPVSLVARVSGSSHPSAVATATGTLKRGGGDTVTLSGTFDTATNRFALTGGGFTVAATVEASAAGTVVNGSVTTPTTQGTVVAVPPPASGTLITYCGNYTGDAHGTIVMVRSDSVLTILAAEAGAPAPFSFRGTLTGTDVFFKFDYAPPDVGSTTGTGTLVGGVMSGPWSATYVEAGRTIQEHGDWIVRAGSCPL